MNHKDAEQLLHRNAEDLSVTDVSDLCVAEPSAVHIHDPVWKTVAVLVEQPINRAVYVVDDNQKLLGIISFRDLLRIVNARLGARRKGIPAFIQYLRDVFMEDVGEMMRRPASVKPSTKLLVALQKMEELKMNDMPVVDDEKRLVGELKGLEILRFALKDIRRGDEETPEAKREAWGSR